jgi:hypothetical protein
MSAWELMGRQVQSPKFKVQTKEPKHHIGKFKAQSSKFKQKNQSIKVEPMQPKAVSFIGLSFGVCLNFGF